MWFQLLMIKINEKYFLAQISLRFNNQRLIIQDKKDMFILQLFFFYFLLELIYYYI